MTKNNKLKIIIDTNILISSLWGGKPYKIIEIWDKGDISVVVNQQVLDEYFNVLNRFDLSEEDIEDMTILFSNPNKTMVVESNLRLNIIKVDPADNKFLECAKVGNADFIISGDKHLLELKEINNTKIVTINEFLNKVYKYK